MSISEQLRKAIKDRNVTLYRISRDSDVDWGTLQRFLDGSRSNIRIDTVDRLCEYLGLELRAKRKKNRRSKMV